MIRSTRSSGRRGGRCWGGKVVEAGGRVVPALGFHRAIDTEGAPSLRFLQGRVRECRQQRSYLRDSNPALVHCHRSGTEPTTGDARRKCDAGRWAQSSWYRQHRTRPCKKRKDGAPTVPYREGKQLARIVHPISPKSGLHLDPASWLDPCPFARVLARRLAIRRTRGSRTNHWTYPTISISAHIQIEPTWMFANPASRAWRAKTIGAGRERQRDHRIAEKHICICGI